MLKSPIQIRIAIEDLPKSLSENIYNALRDRVWDEESWKEDYDNGQITPDYYVLVDGYEVLIDLDVICNITEQEKYEILSIVIPELNRR
jgi:hypothetical protein